MQVLQFWYAKIYTYCCHYSFPYNCFSSCSTGWRYGKAQIPPSPGADTATLSPEAQNQCNAISCSSGTEQSAVGSIIFEHYKQQGEPAAFQLPLKDPTTLQITRCYHELHLQLTLSTAYNIILLISAFKMHNLHAEQLIINLFTSKKNHKVTLHNFQS